jgi:hypothetical protein
VTTTLGFEKMSSWPTLDNQCDALGELTQGPLTMKSRVGSTSGYVWACARRTSYPQAIDSPHIELEAAALATAQLSFPLPVYSIRFDYGAPKGALALDVLVDSNTVQTIDLAKFGRAKFELQLSAPATLIALRSRSAYLQTIAIDNLEFQSDQCPQETPQ